MRRCAENVRKEDFSVENLWEEKCGVKEMFFVRKKPPSRRSEARGEWKVGRKEKNLVDYQIITIVNILFCY